MVDVKIKVALGLIAIMILAAPIAIAQEVPPHVVISAVYPKVNNTHSEWIELYNPTAENVDIGGWTIDTSNDLADATIPDVMIPAHGFYLIADEGFSTEKDDPSWPDADLEELITLTDAHGWCRLNNSVSFVDTVGWGTATTNETLNAVKPAKGESIERKSLDVDYAPCQDTDNNFVDFFKQETPTPKNRSSPKMEPAPVELFDADGNFKGGFVNIQDAVDTASDEDTIRVDNGTYKENVAVAKQLTIRSEHGAAVTTISASNPNDNVIDVTVDYVTISGFNVIGATQKAGMYLDNVDYCNITNNMVSNNNIGISLSSSNDNSIYNNYFENTNNADDDKNNIWNITKIGGTNIIGGPYLGGNYWSDYAGADTDGDGLGDSLLPYNSCGNIQYGGDSLPLVPVGSAPILSIVKSDEHDPVQPGGTLNYTISVENTGNATATNVNVTETYDANVTFLSAVPAPSHGNDTWIFNTLNVSETKWINISVTVNASVLDGTVLHNVVNVSCVEGVTDTDTADTTVSCGEVVQLTGLQTADIVWNKSNFGGFCYDLGDNACIGTETLTIAAGTLEGPNIDRNIEETALTYTTSTIPREYELHKNTGLTVDGDSNYSIGFWMGKRYVAIAGKANKLAKPLVEFDSTDKKTLATGEVWQLGGGFSLVAKHIDLESDKVWFYLYKNGMELHNEVISTSGNYPCERVYTYTEDAAGETDIPIFSCYVDAVFRGTDCNMVQVMYVFLIDNEEILEINVGDEYDNMTVVTVNPSDIVLKNHLQISLLPSTTALIMGNLFFKTTENTSAIEFYPCLVGEGEPQTPKITSFAPPSPVNDTVCNWRTFNVYVDQTVNVRWYLNNTLQHTNVSTKEASYTLHAEVVGEHNVSAIASNENGSDMQTWVWNVTVAPEPVLEITKTDAPDPVSPGGTLNYSISVNNTGNATATNVTVMETYDGNVTFVTAVPVPSLGNDTWQFTSLNVSETRWINISVTVNASVLDGTVLHNVVNVTCDEGVTDTDTENTTVFVAPVPVLEITKSDAPDPVPPGSTLNYSISVDNTGNATATNVRVKETYDGNVTFVRAVPAPSSGDATWKFATLNASETRWIHISVTVNASVLDGTVLHNVANVSCAEGVTDTDTADTTVSCGEVVQLTGAQTADIVWNKSNFGGFCYDLGDDACIGTETLTIAAGTLEGPNIDRNIEETALTYTTSTIPREYELHKNTGLTVDGDSNYSIGFWMGKRYVAIAGKANKLAKPLVEFDSTDKKTLATGEVWQLGGDFSLVAKHIDLESDKVWFCLYKNGMELHNEVISTSGNYPCERVYTYTEDAAGETDIPIFSCYVDAVFRGTDCNMVQVMYVFLIDNEEILEIKVGDEYDNMTVVTVNPSDIVLKNHLQISLLPSTTALIMGNLFFKTTENTSAIEFYPCLVGEGEPQTPKITSFAPPSPVNDTVCNWRTFNVYVDQTVNVRWYLNNTLQHTNVSTKEASYTLHAEVVGEHNVSAIASNENGSDMQTWVWNVTPALEPVLEITKTDAPDPVSPGGTLNYSISVNNTGNATATNVTVKETYDGNVTFVRAVPMPSQGNDTWQFATLNASETRWINISVTVNASVLNGTVLHNIVNVTCGDGVTDTDTENTTVFVAPVLNCTCGDICVNETGWWRDGGAFNASNTPIQHAIDNAIAGETICVKDGTYTENVDVYKRLTIRSENGAASTSVQGASSYDYVFKVTADYVNISGFHVTDATNAASGIYLYVANYCNISDNNANENFYHGIFLNSSSDNTLVNNNANSNNESGIYLYLDSSNNYLINNTASENKGDGFKLESNSNRNSIIGNNASDNDKNGIRLYGTTGNPSSHNMVANNTADLNDKSGIMIEGADSDHNTIVNNTCKSNDYGISVRYGDYNDLTKNTCNQNTVYGIRLYQSADNNEITNNIAISNTEYGIYISSSDYNIIYNNYFNNTNNAYDDGNNVWNTTKTRETNIIGRPYLGGNYWSDYAGRDINGDGLGDTLLPYNSSGDITNDGDYHPLVPVGYAPVLSIEKSDNPDPVSPGGTLNYTICVNNTGSATATNVCVSETYDANVTYKSAVPAPSQGDNTWKFDTLNVNETRRINILVTVNPATPIGTVLHNSVNVSCEEEVADYDIENTTVFSDAVHITSFAPRSPVNDTVCNWRTFNVTVDQMVNVSWYLNGSLLFTNESVRDVSCRLHADAAGVHNVSAIASNGNGSDSHSWVWNVKQPGISITKVSSVTEGVPSTNVNFTINVTNTGDCTFNPVKVVDTLPAGMSYVATGTSPAPSIVQGNTITWNIVDPLNPDASTMISLIAHIDTGAEGTLTNLVNATGKPLAGDNVTDSDTADVTVFEPDIVVISEVFYDESGTDNNEFCVLYNPTDSDIDIGDWTLNAFDQTGTLKTTTTFPGGASITANMFYLIGKKDPLNSGDWGGTAISPDCLRGGSDWQNGPDDYLVLEDSGGNYIDGVRWGHKDGNNPPPIPDVRDNNTAPDAAKGKSIERKPLGGGYAPCQDTDDNSFDFVVQETPTPKNSSSRETGISVTKVGNVTDAAPSTLVKFNITVTNTGNCTLTHVLVEDTLPAGMTYSSSDPLANSTNGAIIWDDVGPLAANLSKTIELVAKIAEDATGVLNNTVNVTGTPENATNVSASATAQVRVIRLGIEKSCSSSTVSLGGTVTYTIEYSNPGGTNLTNVVITENYPDGLTFISAVPAPDSGTNNKWTIGTLPAGESGRITIKMKVPDSMSDLSYEESGSVSGEGIVMISKELSTMVEPYKLENIVTISGSYGATNVSATASAITTVMSGSSLEITEHGSGTYESEEELSLSPKNGGISFDKTTNAKYSPTTFKCSDGFVMDVHSKWSQDICIKNYAKEIAIHKTITEATALEDDTRINTNNDGYSMDFDSTFLGYLHVDKKTKDAATSEHYIGEFVIKDWDESGDEIVEGVGYVIVDKELASGRLLLMEHGSGIYSSEEDSSSSSIKKITDAKYEPTSFNFSDGFVVNFSSKWMQEFCTRNKKGTTVLHKKIRDATYIDDDTTAKSRPSLIFHTFFYGATHVGSKSKYSRASEDYIGDFYISWAATTDCTFVFDWDDVPGPDDNKLIRHLNEPRFGMPWVTDPDVEITKPVKDTIDISAPGHLAEIILDTKTNETAELIIDGVDTYTFNVEKHGDTLKVYDCELERKPEVVSGEGFVMIDEAIFKDGEIEVTEHGSGTYYSEEAFGSKTIKKETYGVYKPTYFSFSDSFAVNFSSKWMQDICAKDKDEGTAIHKKISDAALMKDDTIAARSLMNITSSFNGSMHIGARTENVSISEDYIGEFNVTEHIEIVKEKPPKSSSESSDWLSCPFPIPSSIYQWFCQDPTYRGRWLSVCPYPYADTWLYIHP